MKRRDSWWRRLATTSIADVGAAAQGAVKRRIYEDIKREVMNDLVRKDFSDVGPAETVNSDYVLYGIDGRETSNELAGLYEIHLWIQTCVSIVATSLPLAPLRFYRATGFSEGREELEPWDDHPANQLMRWINPYMDTFAFWEWQMSFLQLTGEAFVAKVPASKGAPNGVDYDLYPLFPAFVRKVLDNRKGIVEYKYRVHGEKEQTFKADEVMHFKTFNVSDRWAGQGIMHAGRQTVLTDLRAQRFNDSLLKSGVYMHGTLEADEDLEQGDAEAMRDDFVAKYGGSGNAAKIAVLWGGMQFKPHQIAHNDIQWLEQRKMSQEEIAIAHGVPLELLGIKAANFATLQEKRKIFWQDTVQRWGTRLEHQMNSTGLPMLFGDDSLRCAWDYSQIDALQPNIADIVKAGEVAIRSGQVTPDEWRQMQLQLPPLGGASELQLISGSLKPIEAMAASAAREIEGQTEPDPQRLPGQPVEEDGGEPQEPQEPEDEEQRNDNRNADKSRRRLHLASTAPRLEKALRARVIVGVEQKAKARWREQWELVEQRFENRMAIDLRNVSRESQREVMKLLSQTSHLDDPAVLRQVEHIFIVEGSQTAEQAAKQVIKAGMEKWSDVVAAEVGMGSVFNMRNEVAEDWMRKRTPYLRDHFGRNGRKLSREIMEGFRKGENNQEIAKRLRGFMRGYRNQAKTVARTEVGGALNFSANEAMVEARMHGADVRSRWVTAHDENVRGGGGSNYDHASADGLEIFPDSEVFVVSGESMAHPMDSTNGASPGNIINCRCTTQPVVKVPARV